MFQFISSYAPSWKSVWTAATAGGLLGSALTTTLGVWCGRHRMWRLSRSLRVDGCLVTDSFRVHIENCGSETIIDAVGLLSLTHQKEDIVPQPKGFPPSRIGPEHTEALRNGYLSWAIGGNPYKIEIYPGVQKILDLAERWDHQERFIRIPSEQGYGNNVEDEGGRRYCRMYLVRKKYRGTLSIVGKNILPQDYEIEIDPASPTYTRRLSRVKTIGWARFVLCGSAKKSG